MNLINNKKIRIALILLVVIAAPLFWWIHQIFLGANTSFEDKSKIVLVRYSADLEEWLTSNEASFIDNPESFKQAASFKKFSRPKPGRYRIKNGMSNNAMINMLRSGDQESLNIRIDDVHDLEALAGKLGRQLQYDSVAFMTVFTNDSICASYQCNTYTLPSIIIPNTYDFFWTMSPDDFLKRMNKISKQYWTEDKVKQANSLGLSMAEVSTLASIVKAETAKREEAPKIAGLYLNRLRVGQALQSDPTAVFGKKVHSQRVYLSDLQNDSPYNTYQHVGLPPGPIDFTETLYLDAVLHAEKHNYIFMCAQAGGTGFHNFSKTLDQHNVYRREYINWLEKQGVR